MRQLMIGFFAAALLCSPALAQSGVTVGELGYGGSGCPDGTAKVSLSTGGKGLALRFTRYRAVASGSKSFDRKSCAISVPVSVPAGKSVTAIAADYRGYNRLPSGASSRFNVEYFTPGTEGEVATRSFKGPTSGAFTLSDRGAAIASRCGQDFVLRINTSLRVTAGSRGEASATISSQDVSTALAYRFELRDC